MKLIDFGFSIYFEEDGSFFEKKLGTLLYAAPEIYKGNYNEKCDIWAVGCVLFVMLSGDMPFADKKEI